MASSTFTMSRSMTVVVWGVDDCAISFCVPAEQVVSHGGGIANGRISLILTVERWLSGRSKLRLSSSPHVAASNHRLRFYLLTIPSNSCGRNNGVAHSVQVSPTILS